MNLSLPSRPNLEQLHKQAKDLLRLHRRKAPQCCGVLRRLRQFAQARDEQILRADLALNDAQFALALYYGYESWADLKRHAETQHETPAPRLERTGEDACIHGLERLDWGGSFFQRQESFMTCLTAVLRCGGIDTSFEEVMGLSGAAFKLTINCPWCPSAASSEEGADCPDRALKAFGFATEFIGLKEHERADLPEPVRRQIVESVDGGLPVMFMDGEFSLVVGYRDDGRWWVCKPYPGGEGYREMEQLRGMLGPAWWLQRFRRAGERMGRPEAVRFALQTAVEFATTPSFEEGSANGFAAYEAWIEDLKNPPAEPNLHANAYSYAILLTSRAAAAAFLGTVARELPGEGGQAIGEAARRYAAVSERLLAGRDCVAHPWEQSWTAANRKAQADILASNLADEREAVAQIERAIPLLRLG